MAPQTAPVAVDRRMSQHAITISTEVQFMGEKQALVIIYGGEYFRDDTLKGIAEGALQVFLRNRDATRSDVWDATNVWQDINPVNATRYVQMVMRTKPTARR